MQNYNWDIQSQFVFPEELGIVEDVVSVDIKPRWQLIETEDSLRLVGIYHITSTVSFDPKELPEYSEGTMIEHLELMGDAGYFEYALPLEVNLPKEKVPEGSIPDISIQDVRYDIYDGASCTFTWDVLCTVSEPVVESFEQSVGQEDVLKFESYDEPIDHQHEIPSATAFVELVQVPVSQSEIEKKDSDEVSVSFDDNTSHEESYSNPSEPESVVPSSSFLNPEKEELSNESEVENQLVLEQVNQQEEELVQVESVSQEEELVQVESVSQEEELVQVESVSQEEELVQVESVSQEEELVQVESVSQEEELVQVESVSQEEELVQVESVSQEEELVQVESVSQKEELVQVESVSQKEELVQVKSVSQKEELVQVESVSQEELVQAENLIQEAEPEVELEPIDRAFDNDDFYSDLSESFTILDLKSNKVSPE